MAGSNSKSEEPKTSYESLEVMTQEFNGYLEKTGITECLTNVLKLLYEMDEKPVNPLEFMRVNMTEFISEREELAELQEEYDNIMQQIAALQQENSELEEKLQLNFEDDLKNEESFSSLLNDDKKKSDSIM